MDASAFVPTLHGVFTLPCRWLIRMLWPVTPSFLLVSRGHLVYIYIYAFSRRFYPKRLTLHSSYSFTFYQLLLSLGIEPMILALLMPCSTIWATGKLSGLSGTGWDQTEVWLCLRGCFGKQWAVVDCKGWVLIQILIRKLSIWLDSDSFGHILSSYCLFYLHMKKFN